MRRLCGQAPCVTILGGDEGDDAFGMLGLLQAMTLTADSRIVNNLIATVSPVL